VLFLVVTVQSHACIPYARKRIQGQSKESQHRHLDEEVASTMLLSVESCKEYEKRPQTSAEPVNLKSVGCDESGWEMRLQHASEHPWRCRPAEERRESTYKEESLIGNIAKRPSTAPVASNSHAGTSATSAARLTANQHRVFEREIKLIRCRFYEEQARVSELQAQREILLASIAAASSVSMDSIPSTRTSQPSTPGEDSQGVAAARSE
jgi:hypothetical protein